MKEVTVRWRYCSEDTKEHEDVSPKKIDWSVNERALQPNLHVDVGKIDSRGPYSGY